MVRFCRKTILIARNMRPGGGRTEFFVLFVCLVQTRHLHPLYQKADDLTAEELKVTEETKEAGGGVTVVRGP